MMISKVLSIALAEDGYLEKNKKFKNDNAVLEQKLSGAGSDNVTKYWRDLKPEWQGSYWCLAFVIWCYEKAFGREEAKNQLYMPTYTYSCTQAIKYFLNNDSYYSEGQAGDLIFFSDSNGKPCHVGALLKTDGIRYYTIEGNTTSDKGVVSNGGAVNQKIYAKTYKRILGFGRPKCNTDKTRTLLSMGSKGADVYYLQKRLTAKGYALGSIDGDFGIKTQQAVIQYQRDNDIAVSGRADNIWNII